MDGDCISLNFTGFIYCVIKILSSHHVEHATVNICSITLYNPILLHKTLINIIMLNLVQSL